MTLQNASARQLGFEIPVERHSPEMYLSDTGKRLWRNRFHRPKGLLVGIAPYSGWISREWPLNRWKVVTDYLIENHGAILVYLGKNDRPYPWLGFNMSGLTDLRELALLLEQCDLLLTVDNGIMHMAAAVGTPTVAIFGPVLAKYRCSGYHEFISIQSTNCVGCYHLPDWTIPPRVCPLKHHNCMTDITPMQVIDACVRQLSDLKDKPHDRK
jgi:ADP-heptose:LPS heptosyltransferase